jgi:hypothetical protein
MPLCHKLMNEKEVLCFASCVSRTCQIVPAATASMVAPLTEEKVQLRFVAEEHKWMAINKSVV